MFLHIISSDKDISGVDSVDSVDRIYPIQLC